MKGLRGAVEWATRGTVWHGFKLGRWMYYVCISLQQKRKQDDSCSSTFPTLSWSRVVKPAWSGVVSVEYSSAHVYGRSISALRPPRVGSTGSWGCQRVQNYHIFFCRYSKFIPLYSNASTICRFNDIWMYRISTINWNRLQLLAKCTKIYVDRARHKWWKSILF